jgi:hypothetical protein
LIADSQRPALFFGASEWQVPHPVSAARCLWLLLLWAFVYLRQRRRINALARAYGYNPDLYQQRGECTRGG